jgi:hypothetical protein
VGGLEDDIPQKKFIPFFSVYYQLLLLIKHRTFFLDLRRVFSRRGEIPKKRKISSF